MKKRDFKRYPHCTIHVAIDSYQLLLKWFITGLLLSFSQFSFAQALSWDNLDQELAYLRQRADSLWFFGTPPEPIIEGIMNVQEAACEGGYDDLWVLGFCDLAEVYDQVLDLDNYVHNVEIGWGNAELLLNEDDPIFAVAQAGIGQYWSYLGFQRDDVDFALKSNDILLDAHPKLERYNHKAALFECQLKLAENYLYIFGMPDKAKYWAQRAENTARLNLIPESMRYRNLYYQWSIYNEFTGSFSEAIKFANLSLDIFEERQSMSHGDSIEWTAQLHNLSLLYYRIGQVPTAIEEIENAIQLINSFTVLDREDSASLASSYNYLALFYANTGGLENSVEGFLNAIKIFESLSSSTRNDSSQLAGLYSNLATTYEMNRNLPAAIELQNRSLKQFESMSKPSRSDSAALITVYNNLASYLLANGEVDKAIQALENTLSTYEELSSLVYLDSLKMLAVYGNIATSYLAQGNIERSIFTRKKALAMHRLSKDDSRDLFGRELYNLGKTYFESGKLDLALENLNKSIELLEEPENLDMARYNILALVLTSSFPIEMVEIEQADSYLRKAEVVAERWNITLESVFLGQAILANRQGDYERALTLNKRSRFIINNIYPFGSEDRRRVLEAIGDVYLATTDYDSALVYHHLALLNCSKDSSHSNYHLNPQLEQLKVDQHLIVSTWKKGLTQYALAKELESDSLLRESFSSYSLGEAASRRQRNSFSGNTSRLQVSKDAQPLFTGAMRTALDLNMLTDSLHYLNFAFASAEQNKGQTMLQAQWEAEATGQGYLPKQLHTERRNHLTNLQFVEEKIGKALENRDTLEAARLQSRAFEIQEDLEKWEALISELFPEYHKRLYRDFKVDPDEIQERLLEEDETLIEFAIGRGERFGSNQIGEDELYTFILSQDSFKVLRAPLSPEFNTTITSFVRSIKDYHYIHDSTIASYKSYTKSAFQLYNWLLAPALSQMPSFKKLIVIPDGQLNQIPFEALLTEEGSQEMIDYSTLAYLDHEVQYGYSATQLLEVKNREPYQKVDGILAMAPSGPNSSVSTSPDKMELSRGPFTEELPGATNEVGGVFELGYPGLYLFGDEASEDTFKVLAEDYRILYLAQHGYADSENPVMSYLQFASSVDGNEDGQMHAYELEALRLKADLAVLSACETGAGEYLSGEGVASLGRQFIAAGVATVVMTLWEVEDQASADLMKRFFTYLEEGEESAKALHLAKLDFLANSDSRTAHPYYWAGYIANGDSREIPLGSSGFLNQWGLWLLGGFTLFGFGWRWRRRRKRLA